MTGKITHEAEVSRQHARFPIPASVRIKGTELPTREWSVSGFSAENVPANLIGSERFHKATLIFDLDTFALSVDLEFEVMRFEERTGVLSARYMNVPKGNLSLLHYVINSYLAGEVVVAGDILSVAARDDFVERDLDAEIEAEEAGTPAQEAARKTKRSLGFVGMVAVFVLLIWFIVFTLYNRLFVIEALSARVQGPVVVLRAPENGQFEATVSQVGPTTTGAMLGVVKLYNGGVASIESPCDCQLMEVLSLNDAFVSRGQELYSLLPKNAEMRVEAQVDFKNVSELKIGQEAEIKLPDGSYQTAVVKQVRAVNSLNDLQQAGTGNAARTALVVLAADDPIPSSMLGAGVSVRINTLWERADAAGP
jgi:alginate biosynthesis protein Alg44